MRDFPLSEFRKQGERHALLVFDGDLRGGEFHGLAASELELHFSRFDDDVLVNTKY